MSVSDLDKRDTFIENFLAKCLDYELNHDAFEIWSTLAWWLPAVVDLRRSKTFFAILSTPMACLTVNLMQPHIKPPKFTC